MKKIIYKFLLGIVFIVGCGDDDTTSIDEPTNDDLSNIEKEIDE